MTEPTAEFSFGSWSASQIPLAISYPLEVMDEIRAAATDGLQKLARGGLDVAGVMYGVRREAGIRILTWRPILCEHALGPTLQLSERDRMELTRSLEAASAEPDLKGLQPVGWFLSHTRSGISLSPGDLEIFASFFPEPWQVTLVLQPSQAGVSRAGFFAREAEGRVQSAASYQEFVLKPLHRVARASEPPGGMKGRLGPPAAEPPAAKVAAPEPRQAKVVEPPRFGTLERPSSHRRWLWMLAILLALITAGFLVKEFLVRENQSFSLRVYDAGEMVQIEWNQGAAPIRNAHLGVIDIQDSGETKRYSLADDELHQGKMSYLRRGGDLELRMTVYPAGSTPVHEFVHFVQGSAPADPPRPSEVDQLRRQRDQLDAQVKQLKEDLKKEKRRRR